MHAPRGVVGCISQIVNYLGQVSREVKGDKQRLVTFIDIRLRSGRARNSDGFQAGHASSYSPLRPNVTSSIKPEVHNV